MTTGNLKEWEIREIEQLRDEAIGPDPLDGVGL